MSQIVKYSGGGAIAPALVGKVKAFDTGRTHLNFMLTEYGILEKNS